MKQKKTIELLPATSDVRPKLRCRVCGRRFRWTSDVYERVYDHLEIKHPAQVLPFWDEVRELRRQEGHET